MKICKYIKDMISRSIISSSPAEFFLSHWLKCLVFLLTLPDLRGWVEVADSDPELAWTGTEAVPWMTDWMGVILLKNLLFLREMSPDPSILTLYCR